MAGTATVSVSSRKGRGLLRVSIDLVCDAGAVGALPIGSFFGRIVGLYTDATQGAGATMTSTADILLTDAATGAAIISDLSFGAAESYRPTGVVVDKAGAAITPATTANDLNRDIFVGGKLNIAIANATTTDTGRLVLLIEEAV